MSELTDAEFLEELASENHRDFHWSDADRLRKIAAKLREMETPKKRTRIKTYAEIVDGGSKHEQ